MPSTCGGLPSMRTGARGHCRSCQVRGDRKCVSCARQPDGIARWSGTGGRSNNRAGGDTSMTNKAERRPRSSAISRRRLVTSLTVGVGAAAIISRTGLAQRVQVAPPSTITNPPRDFGPHGAPTTYFTDPDVLSVDPLFDGYRPAQQRHQAAVDRRAVGGGAGLERRGPLSRLERHPEQPAAALARGRRPRDVFRMPSNNSNGNTLRLPGPAALLRAPDAPRRPLRARRLDHGARRLLQRQAPQLAERRRPASRRQLLVHRPALRRPALRGGARRGGRAEQRRRAAQAPPRPGRRDRRR